MNMYMVSVTTIYHILQVFWPFRFFFTLVFHKSALPRLGNTDQKYLDETENLFLPNLLEYGNQEKKFYL
jgi:hypothetical protein